MMFTIIKEKNKQTNNIQEFVCDFETDINNLPIDIAAGTGFLQGIFLPYGITVDDEADGIRNGGFGSTTGK